MAKRVLRKRQKRLAARIKQFETDNTKPNKHEHHRPGSMSGRK